MNKKNEWNRYKLFFGDIHNHCDISYGYGPLDDAFANAQLQLDFVSVTGHAYWPDMPDGDGRLASVVEYHEAGFRKFERLWDGYLERINAENSPGRFVTFPSFEWHSMADGDHVVYFRTDEAKLFTARTLDELREKARSLGLESADLMFIPHHIGYEPGYRGINWKTFDGSSSPVIEIVSMHGCAESEFAPFPYLHTMGPRVMVNTMVGGLSQRARFGVIGSTDHHNAHPGSYGHGRAAVWATDLSRESIWEAIRERRTYAVTGDRIAVAFELNGSPMGSELPMTEKREIRIAVDGGYALDHVELVKNGTVLHRWDAGAGTLYRRKPNEVPDRIHGKLLVQVGWGESGVQQDWDVELRFSNGSIVNVEPRFRGVDIVDPKALSPNADGATRFSAWEQRGDNAVNFRTRTFGNPTPSTDATQSISIELEGTSQTSLKIAANGTEREFQLAQLLEGSDSFHLGGFLTAAVRVHRISTEPEYVANLEYRDDEDAQQGDWYYVRVAQQNGQWAWTSPIWVG